MPNAECRQQYKAGLCSAGQEADMQCISCGRGPGTNSWVLGRAAEHGAAVYVSSRKMMGSRCC